MTFGPDHYVSVLKVKRGEKAALRGIEPGLQLRMSPLLEIVQRTKPTVAEHLDTAFKGLAESLQPYPRCFFDAREIAPDGPSAAEEVFYRATASGIVFTPVTGVTRTEDVGAALKYRIHGIALRLTREEFESGQLQAAVSEFLTDHFIEPEEIDLIIDLGPVDDFVNEGIIGLTEAFLSEVPDHTRWRTFTISACAFPSNMGAVNRNSYAYVKRGEWIAWRNNLYARRGEIPRLPSFSDCAIQHTTGVEGFDPRIMQASAAIRYALADHWILTKGESTRNISPSIQFPALATHLVYGVYRNSYLGAAHCGGCALMNASADGTPGIGSPEAWRRLGTIHHISTASIGLDALTWP
jgi:hypothetical protein